jgi:hypothetical protein
MPRVLQFVLIAWNILLAFTILAYNIPSGFMLAFESSIPKYLKFYTVSIYLPYISIYASQFTNMAFVLSILITSAFWLQNYTKQSTRLCN